MSKIKNKKKAFFLEEENGKVIAKLDAIEDYTLDMEIYEVPNVRVRAPRPSEKHLEEMAEHWASIDHNFETSQEWLEYYADSMNRQIIDQIQDIRKCMKRIQSLSCCIKTAQRIVKKNENKT